MFNRALRSFWFIIFIRKNRTMTYSYFVAYNLFVCFLILSLDIITGYLN